MQEARRRIRLSWMALAFFLACLAVLHILNWDNLPRHMSEFVRARGSILWGAGLLALAAGLIGLGFSLPQVLPTDKDARLACRLLVAAGLVTLLLVVFPTDVTPQPSTFPGYMHDIGALSALCLQGCAMFILVDVGRRIPPWAAVAGRTFFWPGAALTFGNIWGLGDLTSWWPLSAIMQRVMAVLMVGWLIVLAVRATGFESAPASVAEPTSA